MSNPADRNRWESLLEDLGLPVEKPVAETQPAPPLDHEPKPQPVLEAPPLPPEKLTTAGGSRRRLSPVETPVVEPVEPEKGEPATPAEEVSDSGGSEAPAGRRRRRTRSGRGSRREPLETNETVGGPPPEDVVEEGVTLEAKTDDAEDSEAGESEEAGTDTEQPGRSRRRRRSRSRNRGKKVTSEAGEILETASQEPGEMERAEEEEGPEVLEEEEDEPRIIRGDDDEELDDLSNWSVPSWQDLIASLYKPDR